VLKRLSVAGFEVIGDIRAADVAKKDAGIPFDARQDGKEAGVKVIIVQVEIERKCNRAHGNSLQRGTVPLQGRSCKNTTAPAPREGRHTQACSRSPYRGDAEPS